MLSTAAGFVSGILSSMGMGGGSILIMILSGFMSVEQQRAQGVNLLYFIPVSVLSVIRLKREKLLELKTALLLGAGGVPASVITGLIAVRLRGEALRVIFGLCVFAYGVFSLASVKRDKER